MAWLLLGLALLLLTLFLLRLFVGADPRALAHAVRWGALAIGVVVALVLLLSGRLGLVWTALIFLLPWLSRLRLQRRREKAARGPSQNQRSEVSTRFVTMRLDHDTGAMDGEVREGPHAGRRLSTLTLDEVLGVLRAAMHEDMQSTQVLEAYLDRAHGPSWRQASAEQTGGGAGSPPPSGSMSKAEAYAILGLEPGEGEEAIRRAHRRLMQQYHPDRGGSDYLAARINEAKDVLLGR